MDRFTKADIKKMTDFGNYVLSDERKGRFTESKSLPPVKDRLKNVTHADLANFLSMRGKKVSGYTNSG